MLLNLVFKKKKCSICPYDNRTLDWGVFRKFVCGCACWTFEILTFAIPNFVPVYQPSAYQFCAKNTQYCSTLPWFSLVPYFHPSVYQFVQKKKKNHPVLLKFTIIYSKYTQFMQIGHLRLWWKKTKTWSPFQNLAKTPQKAGTVISVSLKTKRLKQLA